MQLTILILCVWGMFMLRMHRVSKLCDYMLDVVAELSRKDIINKSEKHWDWRFRELEKVSFDQLVFHIWKPVTAEAFWDDLSFLEE